MGSGFQYGGHKDDAGDEKDKDSRSHPKRRFFHRRHYTRPFPDHNKHLYYSAPAAEKSTGKP